MKKILTIALLLVTMMAFAQHEKLDYSTVTTYQDFADYEEIDLVCQRDGKRIFGKVYRPKASYGKKVPMVMASGLAQILQSCPA